VALPAGSQEVVLAVVMLLVLIFRRDGLTRGREFVWPSSRRQTGSGDVT
jgi:branched-chain amino acid transport system permease protein